ncbi:MAG: HNH endonuclease [Bifidobacteriaceae bacterium]|jgi:hypothetical protein|nr:HNH endonuclease [Bifidobacteriaceae bacterium]
MTQNTAARLPLNPSDPPPGLSEDRSAALRAVPDNPPDRAPDTVAEAEAEWEEMASEELLEAAGATPPGLARLKLLAVLGDRELDPRQLVSKAALSRELSLWAEYQACLDLAQAADQWAQREQAELDYADQARARRGAQPEAGWRAGPDAAAEAKAAGEASVRRRADREMREEYALLTAQTSRAAGRSLRMARAGEEFAELGRAMAGGKMCLTKAEIVVQAAGRLDSDQDKAQIVGLGVSLSRTAPSPKVRDGVDSLAAKLDPEGFTGAHRRAYAERHVAFAPRPAGMAELRIFGALDHLAAIHRAATDAAWAQAGKSDKKDPRDLDQRRYELIVGHLAHALAAHALAGHAEGDGESGGARDGIVQNGDGVAGGYQAGENGMDGHAGDWGAGCACGGTGPLGGIGTALKAHLHVVVNATTLLGLDNQPARLLGLGPIPAEIARRIATDATWQALFADSDSGRLIGLGADILRAGAVFEPAPHPGSERGRWDRARAWPSEALDHDQYQPTLAQKELTGLRDQTCRNPVCNQPAARCEYDHVNPFRTDRPAAEYSYTGNIQLLCKTHHQLKTHSGWQYDRDPETGKTAIVTALGFTSQIEPETILP